MADTVFEDTASTPTPEPDEHYEVRIAAQDEQIANLRRLNEVQAGTIQGLTEQVNALLGTINRLEDREQRLQNWRDNVLVPRLHREADNRDYCSEFDDVMEGLGLPRRTRSYEVEVVFTLRTSISVQAESDDTAYSKVMADGETLRARYQDIVARLSLHGGDMLHVTSELPDGLVVNDAYAVLGDSEAN